MDGGIGTAQLWMRVLDGSDSEPPPGRWGPAAVMLTCACDAVRSADALTRDGTDPLKTLCSRHVKNLSLVAELSPAPSPDSVSSIRVTTQPKRTSHFTDQGILCPKDPGMRHPTITHRAVTRYFSDEIAKRGISSVVP